MLLMKGWTPIAGLAVISFVLFYLCFTPLISQMRKKSHQVTRILNHVGTTKIQHIRENSSAP